MKTIIVAIGLALALTGSIIFVANAKYENHKLADLTSTPTPIQEVAADTVSIEPTIEPTIQPTTRPIIPTYPPTSTPIPTIAIPTDNPNKDSICRNEAQLKKIQLKEQLTQLAYQKLPPDVDWSYWMQDIENQAQKAYLQIYNICLTR